MRATLVVALIAGLSAAPASYVGAQPQGRPNRPPPDRAQLERRFREGLASVVQRRLALNDEQMKRLSEVNQRYEAKRMELMRRERDARMRMRQELMSDSTPPNEERVSQLLQESSRIQRERLDLIDAEQNDLSKFLTPTQRAKYLGIQEQMRRRIDEMRDRPPMWDEPGGPGRGRGRRPPP